MSIFVYLSVWYYTVNFIFLLVLLFAFMSAFYYAMRTFDMVLIKETYLLTCLLLVHNSLVNTINILFFVLYGLLTDILLICH